MTNIAGLADRAAATAQVVVVDLDAPVMNSEDTHHLTKVLRLRNGESVSVTDGMGKWCICEWANATLRPTSDIRQDPPPKQTAVAFALTKGDKPEWTVQKLTEIGIMTIVPFISERTVVKWDTDKRAKNTGRFRKIAYEASMQSRRVWLPAVDDIAAGIPQGYAIAAPGGSSQLQDVNQIAIGPEGGWSEVEISSAINTVDLGETILRAETAALVAASRMISTN